MKVYQLIEKPNLSNDDREIIATFLNEEDANQALIDYMSNWEQIESKHQENETLMRWHEFDAFYLEFYDKNPLYSTCGVCIEEIEILESYDPKMLEVKEI